MGKHSQTLKTLRSMALDHAVGAHPDLAALARDLGRVVHEDASTLAGRLGVLSAREQPFRRWLLAERRKPAISVVLIAWPANHVTPVHDHAGLWGLEMTLAGALEVQSYAKDSASDALRTGRREWLGPGDSTWFDGSNNHLHRCRNLSRHDTALTFHVYGGNLSQYFAYEQTGPDGLWVARPQRSAIASHLR
jgi:predicted metal-dependent enzyme (double-stranded beta helix superfamily)